MLEALPNGRTQRRVLPRYQIEEMEILTISIPRVGIEPACRVYLKTYQNLINMKKSACLRFH